MCFFLIFLTKYCCWAQLEQWLSRKSVQYDKLSALVVFVCSSSSSVRVSVYQTMELWLQVAGASAGLLQGSPAHSELLFSNLLGDISPGADAVKVWIRDSNRFPLGLL